MGKVLLPVQSTVTITTQLKDDFITKNLTSGNATVTVRYSKAMKWLEIDSSSSNVKFSSYSCSIGTVPSSIPKPTSDRYLINAGCVRYGEVASAFNTLIHFSSSGKISLSVDENSLDGSNYWNGTGNVALRIHWSGYWWF